MQRLNPRKPFYQQIVEAIVSLLTAYLFFGSIIGVISDATSFITFRLAIILTSIIVAFVLLTYIWAKLKGIKWVLNNRLLVFRRWGINFLYSIIGVLMVIWTGYAVRLLSADVVLAPNVSHYTLECGFPTIYNRDSLYILVTRFESDVNKVETGCFGKALRDRIDAKAVHLKLPIKICYSDSLYPQTHTEAKQFQKKYFADLVLWGTISSIEKDCSNGSFCFYSQPSDSLITTVGGKVEIETDEILYQSNINPEKIRTGNFSVRFSIKDYNFDKWLLSVYNIKIGNIKPNLYIIDTKADKDETSKEFIQRANLFFQFNRFNEAYSDFTQAINLNPSLAEAYLNRANVRYILGDRKGALSDYNKTLSINPRQSSAYGNRGSLKIDLENPKGAIEDLDEGIKIDPKSAYLYYNRAIAKNKLGNKIGALEDYNTVLLYDPKSYQAYNNRGGVYYKLGDIKKAINDFDKALHINPAFADAYTTRGGIRDSLGNKVGALDDYNKALQLEPSLIKLYYNRGLVKMELGDLNGALYDMNTLIRMNPNSSEAYIVRGNINLSLSNISEAVNDFTKAIDIAPTSSFGYYNRGLAKSLISDKKGAIQDYDKAIKINMNNATYLTSRGDVKFSIGDLEGATQDYNSALRMEPNNKIAIIRINKIKFLNSQKNLKR